MPLDKNKGLHGNCLIRPELGHVEPIMVLSVYILYVNMLALMFDCLYLMSLDSDSHPQLFGA
jgi:hypothetical protein